MSTAKAIVTGLPRGARCYRADLHIHSFGGSHDVEDATMTPRAIVGKAIAEGVGAIAIADHNEINNVSALPKRPRVRAAYGASRRCAEGVPSPSEQASAL